MGEPPYGKLVASRIPHADHVWRLPEGSIIPNNLALHLSPHPHHQHILSFQTDLPYSEAVDILNFVLSILVLNDI